MGEAEPVHATVVRRLLEGARDEGLALRKAGMLYPHLLDWHRWWYRTRDPENSGLVTIFHPWESGADNSPVWDQALLRVPPTEKPDYRRWDTRHVDAGHRPRQEEYGRYMYLVEFLRDSGYAPDRLYQHCPFKVQSVSVNAVLRRSTLDLAFLAERFGGPGEASELRRRAELARRAFAGLWNPASGAYRSHDQIEGGLIDVPTSADFLPLYAGVPERERAAIMAAEIERWGEDVEYRVPSVPAGHPLMERRRYWRGPVWVVVNWMIADGLAGYGFTELAGRIRRDTGRLLRQAGFFEYFDPFDGSGLGGDAFSWTAATGLHWALREEGG